MTTNSEGRKHRLLVAESEGFCPAAVRVLEQQFQLELADLSRSELLNMLDDIDILWVRLRTLIDSEIFDAAPKLKAVITNTTGLNHIDLEGADKRGIRVISLQGETDFLLEIRATAEHTIALALAVLRHIPAAHQDVVRGNWNRDAFKGRELHNKTVGIIGYGRLGRITERYFSAFGARVVVTDTEPFEVTAPIRAADLKTVLRQSDIISLHANYLPANLGMIGEREFGLMKPEAVFINTARGELVDEQSLIAALSSRRLSAAALDVVTDEQKYSPSRCILEYARNHDNLLLTPHIGGCTVESLEKTELFLAERIAREMG